MAAHKAPGDFGRKLREARERRGLSLRQIASATKISMLTLEALEKNDIARLQQVISLRQLGFSLEEIADCLDRPGFSANQIIDLHLARLALFEK